MKYILKNKDIDVLEFEIDKNIKAFTSSTQKVLVFGYQNEI